MPNSHMQITLSEEERLALSKLAQRERRNLKDQAALLIIEGLEERGLLIWKKNQPTQDNPAIDTNNQIIGE